jgi:hypothetical protein
MNAAPKLRKFKLRLLPDAEVFATAVAHAGTLSPALQQAGIGAVAVLFDGFSERHPSLNHRVARRLPRLLSESFPFGSGGDPSIVDIPGQRWFFIAARHSDLVLAGVMAVLSRTGLARVARVFMVESERTLFSQWPDPGQQLIFPVRSDLRPVASTTASPSPLAANSEKKTPSLARRPNTWPVKLLLRLKMLFSSTEHHPNRRSLVNLGCDPGPNNGPKTIPTL